MPDKQLEKFPVTPCQITFVMVNGVELSELDQC